MKFPKISSWGIVLLLSWMIYSCGQKEHPAPQAPDLYELPGPVSRVDSNGITTTLSGYPYQHIRSNGGKTPVPGDRVKYHETIYQNDSIIYSTKLLERPIVSVLPVLSTLPVPHPPDYEALLVMAAGDSLSVVQRLDTFNVKSLPRGVKPSDVFTYHITLVEVVPKAQVDQEIAALKARELSVKDSVATFIQQFQEGKLDDQLKTHESGLKYLVLREGSGRKADAKAGTFVKVHYSGFLKDLTNFDNTFKDAKPFPFRLGRGKVIPGWDIGLDQMAVGGEAVLFVPSGLAYGLAGKPPNIPEKADLVFYVEMLDVY